MRLIESLGDVRGPEWQDFVTRITGPDASPDETVAFVHMMVKLGGCISCNADSFRAMRGCEQCARQTIRRYRGSDADLINLHSQSLKEVTHFIEKKLL
jgi:hypothetical protein